MKLRTLMPALVALAVLLIGGVGAFAVTGAGQADDAALTVRMLDGEIELSTDRLEAGTATIEVRNDGSLEHEPVLVRTNLAPGELPVGLHGVSISQAGELVLGEDHSAESHEHRPGEVLGLTPGQSLRYRVELEPGSHVLFCQTGNHYSAGEHVALEVTANDDA